MAVAVKMTQEVDKENTREESVDVIELNNKLRCFSLQKKEFESWQCKTQEHPSQQKEMELESSDKIPERRCWCL